MGSLGEVRFRQAAQRCFTMKLFDVLEVSQCGRYGLRSQRSADGEVLSAPISFVLKDIGMGFL